MFYVYYVIYYKSKCVCVCVCVCVCCLGLRQITHLQHDSNVCHTYSYATFLSSLSRLMGLCDTKPLISRAITSCPKCLNVKLPLLFCNMTCPLVLVKHNHHLWHKHYCGGNIIYPTLHMGTSRHGYTDNWHLSWQ